MTPPRVLLVHFQFPPSGDVGAQITAKFAKYLPDFGWEPYVLTAKERYYTCTDPTTVQDIRRWDLVRRTGMIPHPRYGYLALKAFLRRWRDDDGSSQGLPSSRTSRSGLRRTMISLLTVPDDLTGWIPQAVIGGLHLIKKNRIDRLFSSGPPWTNHLVAYILRRVTSLPWAACFEDPWGIGLPTLAADESSAMSIHIRRRLERAVVTSAEGIICLNDFHRNVMTANFPDLPAGKFVTIPNGYDPDDFRDADATRTTPPPDRFVLTYTGSIYYNRTPRHLFLAVRRLIDRGVACPKSLLIQFIGRCALAEGQSVRKMVEDHGLTDVIRLSPMIAQGEAIRAMQGSHLLLVLAHDWVLQIPAKVYQYARAGRPILALAPEGATADFVRRSGAGVVVDPFDVEQIAAALEQYLYRFRTGQSVGCADPNFLARFDRRRLTAALSDLLQSLGSPGQIAISGADLSPHVEALQ